MKPLEAPVYVRAHDLARWILEHAMRWPQELRFAVGDALASEARALAINLSLALTFQRERAEWARESDLSVTRLRELLRLARDLGALPAASHRYAQGELLEIGRMVGGWRKRWPLPDEAGFDESFEKETSPWRPGRRRSRRPRREHQERCQEVPVCVPEQEDPREPERQPGVPGARPCSPEPDGAGMIPTGESP